MTKVKICGITDLEDARHAIECGADLLGFNFYDRSPRYISQGAAKDIIAKLKIESRAVGVFVNEKVDRVYDIAISTPINAIQLHGDESPEYVKRLNDWLGLEVIKALRTSDEFDPNGIEDYGDVSILLDAYSLSVYGGSGQVADWEVSKRIVESGRMVYLAGGLTPENVAQAIDVVRPYAVDVASGVESSPGKKDPVKVAEFIDAVRRSAIS